jgi:hypothetical protein
MPTAADHDVDRQLETPEAYRPISTLAIVAAVAGVASLVVLISPEPPLWAVPASAIAIALAALRRIAQSNPPLVGRPLARLGLGLGIAMLVAGPVNRVTRLAWAEREAAAVAQQWIEHIRKGHRRAAHQLSLPLAARCPSDQTLSHCYRNEPDRQEQLDAYLARRDIRQLLLWGEQASYRDPAAVFRGFRGLHDEVDLVYHIDLARDDDPHDHHRSLRILLRRQRDDATGAFYWMVAAVKLADSAAS